MLCIKSVGFPGGASGKEPTCQCRRHRRCGFSACVGKIPWRRAWQPTPVFLPGESHGQRSLAGTDFIEGNITMLQILGSVILIVYASYMILHNPANDQVKDTNDKDDNTRDAITGFLFTLSNPLILFLVIPLFARFGFPSSEYDFYHYIIGYAFIVVGALLWWMAITYLVDKLRAKFNINSMWLINKIMGSIILILAVYGLIAGLLSYFGVI